MCCNVLFSCGGSLWLFPRALLIGPLQLKTTQTLWAPAKISQRPFISVMMSSNHPVIKAMLQKIWLTPFNEREPVLLALSSSNFSKHHWMAPPPNNQRNFQSKMESTREKLSTKSTAGLAQIVFLEEDQNLQNPKTKINLFWTIIENMNVFQIRCVRQILIVPLCNKAIIL